MSECAVRDTEPLVVAVATYHGLPLGVGEAWLPLPPAALGVAHSDTDIVVRGEETDTVGSCTHKGYPDAVGETLAGLLAWIDAQRLRRTSATHRQVYRSAPKGRPADWEVELQVPVAAEGPGD